MSAAGHLLGPPWGRELLKEAQRQLMKNTIYHIAGYWPSKTIAIQLSHEREPAIWEEINLWDLTNSCCQIFGGTFFWSVRTYCMHFRVAYFFETALLKVLLFQASLIRRCKVISIIHPVLRWLLRLCRELSMTFLLFIKLVIYRNRIFMHLLDNGCMKNPI